MKKPFAMTMIAAALMVAGSVQAKEVTDADIANDAKTTGDVVHFGLGQQGQRFSTLDKVNVKTVKNLVPVWSFSFGGEKQRGQESQPVVFDGKMYVTASYSRIFALDAKTSQSQRSLSELREEGLILARTFLCLHWGGFRLFHP